MNLSDPVGFPLCTFVSSVVSGLYKIGDYHKGHEGTQRRTRTISPCRIAAGVAISTEFGDVQW
jgi:hypothetical protein